MDTQIWYAIFSTIYGGFLGAFDHLGEVISQIILLLFMHLSHVVLYDHGPSYIIWNKSFGCVCLASMLCISSCTIYLGWEIIVSRSI